MSESPKSHSKGLFTKQNAAIWALSLAGIASLAHAPEQVWTVVWSTAGVVNGVLSSVGTALNTGISSLANSVPVAQGFAPFAAPMLAGAYIWKKLGDIAGFERNSMKVLSTVVGWIAGATLATSVTAPYITALAAGKLIYDGVNWARHRKSSGWSHTPTAAH
jgi:hypothetical protein